VSLDWTNAEYANACRLYDWFRQQFRLHAIGRDHHVYRRWQDAAHHAGWHKIDRTVELGTVDFWCTQFGWHIQDLPNSVWCHPPRNKKVRVDWDNEPVRHCETCGGEIPFRQPNGRTRPLHVYRTTRFCGTDCRRPEQLEPKPCVNCGGPIPLARQSGRTLTRSEYERAKYCSRACGFEYRRPKAGALGKEPERMAA
jgi:hypothetical protein